MPDTRCQIPDASEDEDVRYEIKNVKIGDGQGWYEQLESESAGTYFFREEESRYYIKWFYEAVGGAKTFTIKYTIKNAVLAHKDIAEFYWKLIGDQWDKGVGFVEVKIYLPEGRFENSSGGENGLENIHGFGHGPLNGKVDIPSKNQVNFSAQNLPSKQFFEVRVLFDKGLLDTSYTESVSDNITLDQILDEEKSFADKTERRKTVGRVGMILGLLGVLGSFGLYLLGFIKYVKKWWKLGKDKLLPEARLAARQVSLSGKLHEPPSDLLPPVVECLLAGRQVC